MGHYNNEYEKYYSKLLNIKKIEQENTDKLIFYEKQSNKKNNSTVLMELKKTLFFGTIASLVMISILLLCKNSENYFGKNIYIQMKKIVSTNFYYKNLNNDEFNKRSAITKTNTLVDKEDNNSKEEKINSFDNFVVVKKNKLELLKESKVIICEGVLSDKTEVAGEKGLIINGTNKEVRIVLDGKVIKVDKHKELGFEVVIDHGEDIKTKYLNIKDVKVNVGDIVKENSIIGYSLNNKEKNLNGILFQILSGENIQNVKEYNNFINN
ncbi:M23 family metallopeptidase [Clostridium tarantellae]|uniref:Peptidoglycan DD-metalloendopeptidase family protein n=1 Tax=Clostridium tarantellae TaxID=39493 RepID=A0A6I1MJB4_9CLOT|nr:M23 family metallopeptidase [Clostridium tarantellae]MPQ42488.1 peptidoglycan DD-metalloendopeptidase family protein [Clostridium tarantellae]